MLKTVPNATRACKLCMRFNVTHKEHSAPLYAINNSTRKEASFS